MDRITKHVFDSISVINQGISFGLFQSPLWIVHLVLFVGLFLFFWRESASHPIPYGLILGGSISNIVDRILFGGVKDWIHLPYGMTNNIADWAIFFGVCILIVQWHHGQRPSAPSPAHFNSV